MLITDKRYCAVYVDYVDSARPEGDDALSLVPVYGAIEHGLIAARGSTPASGMRS